MSEVDRLSVIERWTCPACGDESASPAAEVFCVRCATEDYAITEQRLKVARLEEQLAGAVEAIKAHRESWVTANGPDTTKARPRDRDLWATLDHVGRQ